MKTRLQKNIDLVRIPIKAGVAEYYLPQNVAWADCKIDTLTVCAPDMVGTIDPMDGQSTVLSRTDIANLFFNLYSADERELTHDLSADQLAHDNNYAIEVNEKLNLSLCRLYFTEDPTADGVLLLYVAYGSKCVEDYEQPKNSVTVRFDMQANEILSLRDIMKTYICEIPAKLRGVIAWSGVTDPAYITLRDYALTYNIREAHTELMRPDMNGGSAQDSQVTPFYCDSLDIDFDYSHIRNAQNAPATQVLTFLY